MDKDLQKIYVGIGGAGNELLNQLIAADKAKRNLFAIDTDAQALMNSLSPKRIQIGEKETRGLGTNGNIGMGRRAAEEVQERLATMFENKETAYILTGLRGGTALGVAPVVVSIAKALGVHTTLFVAKDGTNLTEKEKNVLEKWRTLVDEYKIWNLNNGDTNEKQK